VRIRTVDCRAEQYTEEEFLLKQLEYKCMENDLPLYDELVTEVEALKATQEAAAKSSLSPLQWA